MNNKPIVIDKNKILEDMYCKEWPSLGQSIKICQTEHIEKLDLIIDVIDVKENKNEQ